MTAQDIVLRLEQSTQSERFGFIFELTQSFGYFMRAEAFAPPNETAQLKHLQGGMEVFHRLFEQMSDYRKPEATGRPAHDFVELLIDLGKHYGIEGEIGGAFQQAMDRTNIQ